MALHLSSDESESANSDSEEEVQTLFHQSNEKKYSNSNSKIVIKFDQDIEKENVRAFNLQQFDIQDISIN